MLRSNGARVAQDSYAHADSLAGESLQRQMTPPSCQLLTHAPQQAPWTGCSIVTVRPLQCQQDYGSRLTRVKSPPVELKCADYPLTITNTLVVHYICKFGHMVV